MLDEVEEEVEAEDVVACEVEEDVVVEEVEEEDIDPSFINNMCMFVVLINCYLSSHLRTVIESILIFKH